MLALCILATLACSRGGRQSRPPVEARAATLQVAVVGNPRVAEAISVSSSDWTALRGTTVNVAVIADSDRGIEGVDGADVIVCTPAALGALAELRQVRSVPSSTWNSPELGSSEFWPLVCQHDARWGEATVGIPLAGRLLFCYARRDLLAARGDGPPDSWEQYGKIVESLWEEPPANTTPGEDFWPCLEPLAASWAGVALLVRAASYAKHPDYYSVLFDAETMEPRIADPPFVRALEELRRAVGAKGPPPRISPDEVHRAFLEGKAGLAIAWPPSEHADGHPMTRLPAGAWWVRAVPGSNDVYHPARRIWEVRNGSARRVAVLGLGGLVASVSAKSQKAGASFQFLAWLCGREWGPRIASSDPSLQPARPERPGDEPAWPEGGIARDAAVEFRAAHREMILSGEALGVPRIPLRQDYMDALDEAVWACLERRLTPQEALDRAAERWRATTTGVGISRQRSAYRRSLGRPED